MKTLKQLIAATLSAALLGLAPAAMAAEETPQSIPGGKMVGADEARKLQDGGAKMIDTRVPVEFGEQTIKGSINVVYKEKFPRTAKVDAEDAFDLSKLPADKNAALIFFCNGSPCWKGYKGAAAAIKAGHKNVYWFRDGLPAWKAKGYAVE